MMAYFTDRHTEQRSVVVSYLICIALVFLLYILLVLVLVLIIGYKTILIWLFRYGILTPGSFTHIIIGIGRWVILVGMALLTLSLIYYVIPMKKQRVGFFSAGAMFATVMFILLSWGFKIYLANFNRYNLLYGSIGTLLLIMLWLLLNCFVIMLGYELNIAIANGRKHKTKPIPETH
jgi:membrane protein